MRGTETGPSAYPLGQNWLINIWSGADSKEPGYPWLHLDQREQTEMTNIQIFCLKEKNIQGVSICTV